MGNPKVLKAIVLCTNRLLLTGLNMSNLPIVLTLLVTVVGSSPCCLDNEIYSLTDDHCVDQLTFDPSGFSYAVGQGRAQTFNCSDGFHMLNYTTELSVQGSIIEPIFNSTVDEEYYCSHKTDNNLTMVFFCYPTIKVKKCCQLGFAINGQSLGQCVQHDGQFPFTSVVKPLKAPFDVVFDTKNQTHMSLQCQSDYNLFHPFPVFADNAFKILPPGRLFVPAGHYAMFRDIPEEYCVDLITNTGRNASVIAFLRVR